MREDQDGRFKLKRVTELEADAGKAATPSKAEIEQRQHQPIPEQGRWLASVLRGHYNYYAVPDNIEALRAFRRQAVVALAQGAPASQPAHHGDLGADVTASPIDGYPSPASCIPGLTQRFAAITQGRSPVR